MVSQTDIFVGIDAGTSVIKSIAFDENGQQIAAASVANVYETQADGTASQDMNLTWNNCTQTLRDLAKKIDGLRERVVAIGVTGQGDGTWLVGAGNKPVTDAWLWLDSRSAPVVRNLRNVPEDRGRFEKTGTGLNVCQQGSQLAYMKQSHPDWLQAAEVAMHCKDWLYLNLTDVRATDPSESTFTFGNYRTGQYDSDVVDFLGLTEFRRLLPEIIEGTETIHPLTEAAARETGLRAGIPISLGYVDVVCTSLGGGIYSPGQLSGCTIIGSTGMHMRATSVEDVYLNSEGTGYTMMLPVPGTVAQMQSNMAATLNIDWVLSLAGDLLAEHDRAIQRDELIDRIEHWLDRSQPGSLIYHPYISDAGERGPFVNDAARSSFIGLNAAHRFPDLVRAVVESLGLAARDCYEAMGQVPAEVRLSGGAGRSKPLRNIFASAVNTKVRISSRAEAGAAGAAMMAAVGVGAFADMDTCINAWVVPTIGEAESPDPKLSEVYDRLFPIYRDARLAMEPVWEQLNEYRSC